MKKHFNISNLFFVLGLIFLLYTPSRIWLIRQISFSPSVEEVTNTNKIVTDYNWALKGLNTSDVNFSEFKGEVVFVNFWATWCPPCIAELPSVQSFYNDYEGKVKFVFISNESWPEINSFFKDESYDLPAYHYEHRPLAGLPEVKSIPRTFVIDKKGNIRVDKSGAANWNSKSLRGQIDELLKE